MDKHDEIALAMALHTSKAFDLLFSKKELTPAAPSDDEIADWIAERASKRINKCFAVLSDLIEEFSDEQAKHLMAVLIEDPMLAGSLMRAKLVRMVERDREAL
jgi:tRNA A37 methylthiotransferase MiaB